MRKLILSLAAAGTALAVATPAAAQYAPQPQPYGYGAPQYGYNNGYGSNAYGQARALQARIDAVQYRIDRLGYRNDRAKGLRKEARDIERQLQRSARYGLNPYQANDLNNRIARLEQRVNYMAARSYGGYGYNSGFEPRVSWSERPVGRRYAISENKPGPPRSKRRALDFPRFPLGGRSFFGGTSKEPTEKAVSIARRRRDDRYEDDQGISAGKRGDSFFQKRAPGENWGFFGGGDRGVKKKDHGHHAAHARLSALAGAAGARRGGLSLRRGRREISRFRQRHRGQSARPRPSRT